MKPVTKRAKPDYRRVVTCATLATITSLGVFSLVTNVMSTLVGSMTGRAVGHAAQEVRADVATPVVCADSAHVERGTALPLQAI
jgi:hypothetical protein